MHDSDPVDLLMVGAVPLEISPFATRLGLRPDREGPLRASAGKLRVALLSAGIGRPADPAFRRALAELRPTAILNVGFAGALETRLPAGAIVTVRAWRRLAPPFEVVARATPTLHDWATAAISRDAGGVDQVEAITVDRALGDAGERDRLRHASGATIVEMEGAAWAALAVGAGVPFAAVRVVSDHADRPLPGGDAILGKRAWMLRPDGRPRTLRLARALLTSGDWRRPLTRLRDVRAAGRDWARAWRGLQDAAAAVIEHLPSLPPGHRPG